MANSCSKCGAPVSAGAQTCSSCGAPLVAVAGSQAAAPVAAPAKSSNALKIVLIVVGAFVVLGVVAFGALGYVGWRVAHTVKVSHDGKQVSVNVPGGGSFSANTSETYTAADLGTDIYPGATTGKAGARMTMPTGTWVTAVYVTSDPQDKVVAYYKAKLGDGVSVMESGDGAVMSLQKDENESVVVTVTPNSSEYAGKTQIAIVHTKAKKAA